MPAHPASPTRAHEARRHKMGVGLTAVTTTFMGDSYTFIGCWRSIEIRPTTCMRGASCRRCRRRGHRSRREAAAAASRSSCASSKGISAFRVFCFSTRSTAPTSAFAKTARDLATGFAHSTGVLRQIPIWNGDLIAGFVDLALERAFVYREHKASEVVASRAATPLEPTRRKPASPCWKSSPITTMR